LKELEVKTWDEIQDMDFPTEEPIVDELLYCGTYLFVGSPKIGKSFFMLDLCYHIASGKALWGRPVKQGTTLYIAREDDYKRIRKRMHVMYGIGSSSKMKFAVESEGITSGLIEQLEKFVKDNPDIQIIVLDTLQKVRGGNGNDMYNYGADYEMIGKIKDFTDKNRVCLILVHHTRKMEASDPFDMISGSSGLLGAVDGAFVMYKEKRTDNDAKLYVTGRDVADLEIKLKKDLKTLIWKYSSENTASNQTSTDPFVEEINRVVRENGNRWKGTITELRELLPAKLRMDSASSLSRKIKILKDDLYKTYAIKVTYERTAASRVVTLGCDLEYLRKKEDTWEKLTEAEQMELPFEGNKSIEEISK